MKKKYIIIIVIVLAILGVLLNFFINKKENQIKNSAEKNLDTEGDYSLVKKLEEYCKLEEFDYESQVQKNGHISKEDALKIVAIKDKNNIEEYGVSEVIAEINTNENNEKYWFVEVRYSGHSEGINHHYTQYQINYYTGEKLPKSDYEINVSVDGPANFKEGIKN